MKSKRVHCVVLGSGPAGLAFSTAYDREVLLIDKSAELGAGYCSSFLVGNAVVDYGGHSLFSKHDNVLQFLAEHSRVPLVKSRRNALILTGDGVTEFPFQANLHALSTEAKVECLVGLYNAVARASSDDSDDFEAWINSRFGHGIAGRFMIPYNRKVWGFELNSISPHWVRGRVPVPNPEEIIRGTLTTRPYTDLPNYHFYYPETGGFNEIYMGMAQRLEKWMQHGEVAAINSDQKHLLLSDGRTIRYEILVSTLPLDVLARLAPPVAETEAENHAQALRHNSTCLVSFELSSTTAIASSFRTANRLYVADERVCFHRVVFNHRSSPRYLEHHSPSIQCEVTYTDHKPLPDDPLQRCLEKLLEQGILDSPDHVSHSDIRFIPRAYPVPTVKTQQASKGLVESYAAQDIHCIGRFGTWQYLNSDEVVKQALDLAELLNAMV
jgi:UDP-galactopyranose mutase